MPPGFTELGTACTPNPTNGSWEIVQVLTTRRELGRELGILPTVVGRLFKSTLFIAIRLAISEIRAELAIKMKAEVP